MSFEYEGVRRVTYEGEATFIPVCSICGRFVKSDPVIMTNEEAGLIDKENATCKKCGRIEMPFEGFL